MTFLTMSACTVAATGPLLPIPSSSLAQAANSNAAAAMYKNQNFFKALVIQELLIFYMFIVVSSLYQGSMFSEISMSERLNFTV